MTCHVCAKQNCIGECAPKLTLPEDTGLEMTPEIEGQCPNCGEEDEELCFHPQQLRWYCYDCWQRYG